MLIFLLIVLGIAASTSRSDRGDEQIRYSLRRLSLAQDISKNAGLEMDRADRLIASGGIAGSEADYTRLVQDSFLSWAESLRDNINLSGDSSLGLRQKSALTRVEALRKKYSSIARQIDEAVEVSGSGDAARAVSIAAGARNLYMQAFLPGLDALVESEQANAAAADSISKSATSNARVIPLVLAPFGLVIIAVISFLILRDITGSLAILKEGAVRLGEGDLDVVIDTGGDDEFNEVADAFNQMAAELKHKTEELRQYAHTVSHDLKGPLTSVMLAGNLLIEELEPRGLCTREGMPLDELARMMNDNVGKSTAFIDQLLHLAEAGQTPSEVEDVRLSEVVEQVLEERRGDLEDRGIEIRVEGDLGTVLASPAHMYQLFANLVSNAIRYSTGESPVIVIACSGENDQGARAYRVSDNGPGIDPDIIDTIFEPFCKGEDGESGIGLATVAKIVSVYGGAITGRNEGGAVFEFTLKNWQDSGSS